MIKELRKYFKNVLVGQKPCEKILGSTQDVRNFAAFYRDNSELLALLAAHAIYKYTEDEKGFSKEEIVAYKKGLSVLPVFFEECFVEITGIPQEPVK